jgi:hypothetical protein
MTMPSTNDELANADKILLFEVDDEAPPLPYLVPAKTWEEACDQLSGEGAETQLVNALTHLGVEVYAQLGGDHDGNS